MRKLMWFTLGLFLMCVIGAYLDVAYWFPMVAAIMLCGIVSMICLSRWRKHFRIGIAVFLGCMVGALWFWCFDTAYLSNARDLDGETVSTQIEVSDYSWETDYGTCGDGKIQIDDHDYQVRFYLNEKTTLVPGDKIDGNFKMRATTGGEKPATYHRGDGIFLLAYQRGSVRYLLSEYLDAKSFAQYMHLALTNSIQKVFPADTAPFAKALLLGDDTDLDYETDTALKISGIRHVVAVSGFHITILFSMISLLAGKRKVLTALLGIPVLVVFAAIVGFTPSVTRACVMQILVILALLFKREYDPATALSVSTLVMILLNPMVVLSVGFLLSVSCMIGIFFCSEKIKDWILNEKRIGKFHGKSIAARLKRGIASSVSMTLGATVMTVPISAVCFGTVSLISVLTNVLTLWLITFSFYGVMLACGLGLFWLGGGAFVGKVVSWVIRFVIWLAKALADFPIAAVYTVSESITAWLILSYVVLTVFLIFRIKKPLIYGLCVTVSLCVALLISWILPMTSECRLTVLDVDQGQCVLFQSEGKTFMVDCGGSHDDSTADAAAEMLLSQGISKVDGIILTHYDRDHVGAVTNFLTRIPTDSLYLPVTEDEKQLAEPIQMACHGVDTLVEQDICIAYGNTKITLLAPISGKSGNEASMSVLFQTENCDILITGDNNAAGERALLERFQLPKLEVLVVGHHGSKHSTSQALLDATKPDVAVISVGESNSYGHPADEVLERLENCGCRVYRTDLDGTVVYKG